MADEAINVYKAAAPTLLETFLGPIMPWIKAKGAEAGTAAYEALLPTLKTELEAQAEKTAKQTLVLLAVAVGTGLTIWLAFRKRKPKHSRR